MKVSPERLAQLEANPEQATDAERALLTLEVLADVRALRGDVGGLGELIERRAREIARAEIASLCGLVVQRLAECAGDPHVERVAVEADVADVVDDFGKTEHEPGSTT